MAQYGGEQYMKKEDHQTDEHVQNKLHSTTAGQGCKEGKQGVVEKIKEKLPGGDHGTNEHTTHDTKTGQNIGGTGTNMRMGGVHGCKDGKQGVVETIKEKLPGGDQGYDIGGTGTNVHSTKTGQNIGGTGTNMGKGVGHGCEEGKQGVVEKIKEKLPGGDHGADEHTTHTTSTVGGGEYGNVGEEGHEKKGFGGKIKDKLPGGGNQ